MLRATLPSIIWLEVRRRSPCSSANSNLGVRREHTRRLTSTRLNGTRLPRSTANNGKPSSYNYEACAACVDTLAGDVLTLKAGSPRVGTRQCNRSALAPGSPFNGDPDVLICCRVSSEDNEPANKVRSIQITRAQSSLVNLMPWRSRAARLKCTPAPHYAACAKIRGSKTLTLDTALGVAVAGHFHRSGRGV